MKKIIILLLIAASFTAFKLVNEKAAATVEQIEGIYVFMLSKPTTQYDYLGTVEKKGIVMSGKPEEMLDIMLKKAKKEFPECQAIIFTKVDMYKADCVKFK